MKRSRQSMNSTPASLLEEHFQVGRQIDDKVLRDSVPDKRAGELAIEEVRCFYPAPKQHHCERTIVLPGRPEKSLRLGMGGVDLLGPASRHRVVSLRRVDKAARWNAKSAQCDFAQIEELKVRLEQKGRAGPAFQSLEVDMLEACAIGNVSKNTLHQGAARRG